MHRVGTRPAGTLPPVPGPRGPARASGRSQDLDLLRLTAICGVVAIHIVGLVVARADLRGTRQWWAAVAIDLGFVWVVPVFVMVSGALLLHPRMHAQGPAVFYRKRALRIVPPLVAWHLIHLVVVRLALRDEHRSAAAWAMTVIDAKVFTGAYFLWLILGLYAIAPVLAAFLAAGGVRRARITAAAALGWSTVMWLLPGLSALLGAARPVTLGAWTMWLPYVGYFLAGWALRASRPNRRTCWLLRAGAVVLLAEVVWQYGHGGGHPVLKALLPTGYYGGAVALASVLLFTGVTGLVGPAGLPAALARFLPGLADAAFGVFLVHLIVLALLQELVPALAAPPTLRVMLGVYAVVLTLSFAVVAVARRIPYLRALV
ncbi:acyltransferase [Actinocorallia lasiicapitis]